MAEKADMLRKVRALMDKAASTTYEAERDALLAKADAMMTTYTIESWEIEFARPANEREQPVMVEYDYGQTGSYDSDQKLSDLFFHLARYTRVRVGWYGWSKSKIVGYKADIEYLDLLFTTIRLHLQQNIVPHPLPELSYLENLSMLKEAGYKWQKCYEFLVPMYPDRFKLGQVAKEKWEGLGQPERSYIRADDGRVFTRTMPRPVGVRFTGEYTKFCKENKRERIYSSPESYRKWFMVGYVERVKNRLWAMMSNRGETTSGHAMELAGREEDLLKKLYEEFPNLAPHPLDCECDICHSGRCQDRNCRRPRCIERRKPVKYSAPRRPVDEKVDYAARQRGQQTAEQADLLGSRHNLAPKKQLDS